MPPNSQTETPQRVAIDARKWNDYGIGTSIRGLTGGLAALATQQRDLLGDLHFVLLTRDGLWPTDAVPEPQDRFSAARAPKRPYSVAELVGHHRALTACGAALYHSTHYPLPLHLPTPTVVTVHDLIQLEVGAIPGSRGRRLIARAYARAMLQRAVRRANALITVSEHTREQLRQRLGADEVEVVGNGVEADFFSAPSHRDPQLPDGPYVLLVGNPKPHKNVDLALRAFARLLAGTDSEESHPLQLVLVGAEGDDRRRLEERCGELGLADRSRHLGRVASGRLPGLYAHAEIFLFPSLHEGFGLPALEAMAAGTPVVAARAGAIPEVVGDAAILVDPRSETAFAEALKALHGSETRRRELATRGRQRARRFTWQAVAERTVAVYRRLLDPTDTIGYRPGGAS